MRNCERSDIAERFGLAAERIREIAQRPAVSAPFDAWFRDAASYILKITEIRELLRSGRWDMLTEERMREINRGLYAGILPEAYASSWGSPEYSVQTLGEECGRILCFLYSELMGLAAYVFEDRMEAVTVHMEVFIELYNRFEEKAVPSYRELQQILYWFESDYCDLFAAGRVLQEIDPEENNVARLIAAREPEDLRYLYRYGEYITDREISLARELGRMEPDDIRRMASDFTESCCGRLSGGEALRKGAAVGLRYHIGAERLVEAAAEHLTGMGLRTVLLRRAVCIVNRHGAASEGYAGAEPNRQFRYDHREDAALYLDRKFADRRLGVIKSTYEDHRELSEAFAGTIIMETETDEPFIPAEHPAAYRLSNRQREILAGMDAAEALLRETYLPGAGALAGGNILTRKI